VEPIPFARPYIGKEEEEALLGVLHSGWLTTGRETLEFEKEFGDFLNGSGAPGGASSFSSAQVPQGKRDSELYCLAVNSATSGLHLALEASGIGPGDLVFVPSMTFTATAEVVRYLGAEVVFVDTLKGGYHIDPEALECTLDRLNRGLPPYPPRKGGTGKSFGPQGRAGAVMPVHYGGLPCDIKAVLSIAKKYGLKVVEDAAHSFPSFIPAGDRGEKGSWAGTLGDVGVFSFYATKTITSGEGGMVATKNLEMAGRIGVMRSHGIDRNVWNRYTDTKASWYYEVVAPGFKYNLPDLLAALGRAQLKRAMDLLTMRRELARRYDEAFGGDERFIIPPTGPGDARHLYPLRLNPKKLPVNRDEFAGKIQEQGIGISVHFIPLHTMPYYKKRYSLEDEDFPETLAGYRQTISLPLWPGMTEIQTGQVITVVKTLASEYTGGQGPKPH
jgi:dTDP-4-amino-4,6-dideoxygalactose transaminase